MSHKKVMKTTVLSNKMLKSSDYSREGLKFIKEGLKFINFTYDYS